MVLINLKSILCIIVHSPSYNSKFITYPADLVYINCVLINAFVGFCLVVYLDVETEDDNELYDTNITGLNFNFVFVFFVKRIFSYSTHVYVFQFVGNDACDYLDVGEPSYVCEKCGAMMWYEERTRKSSRPRYPKFSMCCLNGRVVIAPYLKLPQPLYDLYHKHDRAGKFFLDNIRSFNSMFAFTSMGGRVINTMNNGNAPPMFVMNGENYHQIGSLLPITGNQPKFAQLYIYDTDNEISNRLAAVRLVHFTSVFFACIPTYTYI